jgi:hypothetical protein
VHTQVSLSCGKREETLGSVLDAQPDDLDASDLLGPIKCEGGGLQRASPQGGASRLSNERQGRRSPDDLTTQYLQCLGERPLLTRAQEVDLAERIDYGRRSIRAILRNAIQVASPLGTARRIQKASKQL